MTLSWLTGGRVPQRAAPRVEPVRGTGPVLRWRAIGGVYRQGRLYGVFCPAEAAVAAPVGPWFREHPQVELRVVDLEVVPVTIRGRLTGAVDSLTGRHGSQVFAWEPPLLPGERIERIAWEDTPKAMERRAKRQDGYPRARRK